jgi:hypothetical protein
LRGNEVDHILGHLELLHERGIDEADTILGDGPEAELGLAGMPELAHHDDIERSI